MPKQNFSPANDIPDLSGKVILVTGGTAGLGRETILSFLAHTPAHVYFTGRSQASADQLLRDAKARFAGVPITFIKCDLASLASVQQAALELTSKISRLDILIANAGILGAPLGLTKEGFEIHFGTNHVGHALLVKLLTPLLTETAKKNDVRVIWVASEAYLFHPSGGIQLDGIRTTQSNLSMIKSDWARYGQSKLANLLYSREYAKHNPSITSVSIHPGVAVTSIGRELSFFNRVQTQLLLGWQAVPPEQCAWNQQWAAVAPLGTGKKEVQSGKHYDPVGVTPTLRRSAPDDVLAEKLWAWTQNELKGY